MLHFEIDADGMAEIIRELEATPKQVRGALSRALQRTATTLRTMAARGLKSELELRTVSLLRKRLKSLKLRATGDGGMKLWFGLNDMPVSWFKGTPRKTADGASSHGKTFAGAFVAKSKFKGRKTIFKRKGKARLHIEEQLLPIVDKAVVFVEDKIFEQTETIFWQYFKRDLQARVKYSLGEQ